ncbi:MAG: universal stress protein [Gammaproteobacteria bacterium]|nr:universal stress protein [Gammaproteobacteria bacterium]MBQ0840041.1 universal stress protein [Gammaproteobacteria bacterium]
MSNVIACIDGSSAAGSVCDYAAWVASRLAAPLTLLHVLDQSRYPVENDLSGKLGVDAREHLLTELAELDTRRNKLALEQGALMLEAARLRAVAGGVAEPVLRQRHGHLIESLAELEDDTRLLVIGKQGEEHSDGTHVGAKHIGDNVERLVRTLHRPILIAQGEFKPPQEVMLAFDSSETTRKGVEMFAASPLFRGLNGHLVSVSKDRQTLSKDLQWAEKTIRDAGHDIQCAVLDGEIEPALHQYQQQHNIDMVVMGAYGHSRLREFFVGSTTNNMIRKATVPHLLLR